MRKFFCCLTLLFAVLSVCLASSTYRISIDRADLMHVDGNIVTLTGDVSLTMDSKDGGKHTLTCSSVTVDPDRNLLSASGNVSLSEDGGQKSFTGDAVTMDWETLDVIVNGGLSSSERQDASGRSVCFYATGERISYSGDGNTVFFNNGVISTHESDPAWSIAAGKLAFAGNDFFIEDATLKIGRVPLLWLPFFFYPGTTLTFNPSIGFSSSKGGYLNTTTEIYGKYKATGNKTTTVSKDDKDVAASLISFLDNGDKSEKVKDGIIYVNADEGGEVSDLEKWAADTGSWLAIMADSYEQKGFAFGYATENHLADGDLIVKSDAMAAWNDKFRYLLDLDISYDVDRTTFSLSMPILSDSSVKQDYLNRNTSFSLDSVFGREQLFPKTYSQTDSYNWELSAKTSVNLGSFNFSLDALKASVEWKWKDSSYQVKQASLPYISFSSNGDILDAEGHAKTKEVQKKWSDPLEQQFAQDLLALGEDGEFSPAIPFESMEYDAEPETVETTPASARLSYRLTEVLDNTYVDGMGFSSLTSTTKGNLTLYASLPGNLFEMTENVNPEFSFTKKSSSQTSDGKMTSSLVASIPAIGLSYKLDTLLLELDGAPFAWDSKHVTKNSIEAGLDAGDFSFSLTANIKPVEESLVPMVSWRGDHANASLSFTFKPSSGKLSAAQADASFNWRADGLAFSIKVSENLNRPKLKGITGSQNASYSGLFNRLNLTETYNFKADFKPVDLTFKVQDKNSSSYVSLMFTGENLDPRKLDVSLKGKREPLYFWKGRCGIAADAGFAFSYDFQNPYSSSMNTSLTLDFSIHRFLDLKASIASKNTSFYRYLDGEAIVWNKLFKDLWRSFDIFGDGIYSTGFNIDTFNIELVHYMSDWNLCCKADGKVGSSGGKYQFMTEVSIFVQWTAIPELETRASWDSNAKEWK